MQSASKVCIEKKKKKKKIHERFLFYIGSDSNFELFLLGDKTKLEKIVQMAWTFVNDRYATFLIHLCSV